MKCQKCEKPATFHITELTGGKPQELHLCEDHVKEYLMQPGGEPSGPSNVAAAIAQHVQQMAIGQTAEELARLDQQTCRSVGSPFTSSVTRDGWAARTTTSRSPPNWSRCCLNIQARPTTWGRSPSDRPPEAKNGCN